MHDKIITANDNQTQNHSEFIQRNFIIQGKKVRVSFPNSKIDDKKIISRVQDILITSYVNDDKIKVNNQNLVS